MGKWFLTRPELEPLVTGLRFERRREHRVLTRDDGEKIFVKFFHERGLVGILRNLFFPRGKKEFEMSERLRERGIESPRSFGYGIFNSGSASVFEYIEGRTFYEEFLSSGDRLRLLEKLAGFLGNLKENGILHTDLHLENLMLVDGKLILVDLHGVEKKKRLSLRDEISNLAHALGMIYPHLTEEEKKSFFSFYGDFKLRKELEEKIGKEKEAWIKRKKERAFRTTSVVTRDGRWCHISGETIKGENVAWKLIKKDKKTEVLSSCRIIKKVYGSRLRLKRAWENAVILRYMGLKIIPKVYSIRLAGLLSRGFILMEDLSKNFLELDRFLDIEYGKMEKEKKGRFLEALSDFISGMLAHWIIHKDLKACNIMVTHDFRFRLLDIEDIRFKKPAMADISEMFFILNTTVPKKISLKDRLRVLFSLKGLSTAEKRSIARKVCELSKGSQIVYEGREGLKVENFS